VLENIEKRNETEGRKKYVSGKPQKVLTQRLSKAKKQLDIVFQKGKFNKQEYLDLIKKIRKDKKLQLKTPLKNKAKSEVRMFYIRYADNWMILTNDKCRVLASLIRGALIFCLCGSYLYREAITVKPSSVHLKYSRGIKQFVRVDSLYKYRKTNPYEDFPSWWGREQNWEPDYKLVVSPK
jgi:hypothetical protein